MKNNVKNLIIMAAVIISPSLSMASENITVANITTKIVDGPNSNGNIHYAIKADVTNNGGDNDVSVKLQAVDSDGFEVEELYLSGTISKGETKSLSDKRIIKEKDYDSIKNWRIDE